MRKQMFKKSHYLMIAFLLLFLTAWPAHSAVLMGDHQQSYSSGINEDKRAAPLMLLAQNQSGGTSSMSLGEIVSLNTKEDGQSSIVSIESNQPVQYTAFKLLNPLRLVLDFPKMDQGNLTSRIQVDKGIVNSIRPIHFKEAGVLRLEIVLNQSADYEIKKPAKNKLIVRLQSSGGESGQEMAQSQPVKETASSDTPMENDVSSTPDGEKVGVYDAAKDSCYPMLYGKKETVSLDFQNADVRNLFRIFAEISGFNVILSPEVGGSVNIRMMDVAWNEAMEIILTNSSLGRECFGSNIVRIATKAVLQAEDSARVSDKARAVVDRANERNAQDLVTEVVRIDNADITELSTSLTALKSARTDAKITVDARTNTLILNDLRKHVDDMLETIKVLDISTAQVLIEAKIVEISKSFTQELGVQWGLTGEAFNKDAGNATISGSTNSTTVNSANNFLVDLAQTANQKAGSLSGFDLAMGQLIPGMTLNLRLEALETQGKGRILSSPKVTTADNKEARIRSGRQIPYQVTSAEGNSIQFVDAELSLTVVPHITTDDRVYMVIDATKNAADFTQLVGTTPTITTKETHTEVLVGNGDTTVLGGIYESTKTENKKEVPFFSKIPLLGLLFQSYADSDTISELLVFITPTIIETN
jgi:type IV pilus assembly protein PilQ